eukprot:CAMPEP_0181531472 /NCGR_PEP_ID=MMETSP1110-20121109/72121_1 /TAXON_ID=174948 /ORGANISM="Symbiodinium sp., Strain CCMP421" /LENGTH=190 /DNA_ID=CAMNT_0023662549 /DNA_START=59 /DNA_END=633 /DNA_ORIENTATION=+
MFALLLVAFLCGVTADSQAERPSSLRGMEPLAFWAEERRLGDDRRRHWRQEHEHEGEEKDEPWEHQEHHEHEDHREDHWEHHEDEEHWRPHWGPHPDPRECFPPFDFCQSCVDGGCMGTPCKGGVQCATPARLAMALASASAQPAKFSVPCATPARLVWEASVSARRAKTGVFLQHDAHDVPKWADIDSW